MDTTVATADELRGRADMVERSDRQIAGRDNAVATTAWLRSRLQEQDLGFTRHREGELIDPTRTWIVRTGYAGQECEVEIRPLAEEDAASYGVGKIRLRLHAGIPTEETMRLECTRLLDRCGVKL